MSSPDGLSAENMTPLLYKLLDAYFDALIRDGTQNDIDEAWLAIHNRDAQLQSELTQAKERIAELHRQTMVLRMRAETHREHPCSGPIVRPRP